MQPWVENREGGLKVSHEVVWTPQSSLHLPQAAKWLFPPPPPQQGTEGLFFGKNEWDTEILDSMIPGQAVKVTLGGREEHEAQDCLFHHNL